MPYAIILIILGLLIHLVVGNSTSHIAQDFIAGVVLLLGGTTFIYCLSSARQVGRIPKPLYERNRQASMLAKKANRGENLSEDEKRKINGLLSANVLTVTPGVKKGKHFLYFKLSDAAIEEAARY